MGHSHNHRCAQETRKACARLLRLESSASSCHLSLSLRLESSSCWEQKQTGLSLFFLGLSFTFSVLKREKERGGQDTALGFLAHTKIFCILNTFYPRLVTQQNKTKYLTSTFFRGLFDKTGAVKMYIVLSFCALNEETLNVNLFLH